jgi:ADP-ribosylglycohydrolase
MFGPIAGDIIGSIFEWNNIKTTEFDLFCSRSRFTDDTVMTVAVADAILHNKDYVTVFKEYGRKYPDAGYGSAFKKWFMSDNSLPYNSFGNGSAMRVSPVGFAFNTIEEVLKEAKRSAEVSHNHPEGIKGAQAAASAIFFARQGRSKKEIKDYIQVNFGYNLERSLDEIRPVYKFDVTCQGSVPEAIIAFLESENFEDAVRKAVSLGGDSDTIACIAGGIAQAFYRVIPEEIIYNTRKRLNVELLKVIEEFNGRFVIYVPF